MKIEIKNLKHSPSLSEETEAYTATIWIDGKRAFRASNHGHGAADDFHPLPDYDGPDLAAVEAWLAENEPPAGPLVDDPAERLASDTGSACDLEILVGRAISDKAIEKDLRRALKKVAMIGPDGKFYTVKAEPTQQNIERIATKYPDHTVVNGKTDETTMLSARAALVGEDPDNFGPEERVLARLRENRLTAADCRYLITRERASAKPDSALIEDLTSTAEQQERAEHQFWASREAARKEAQRATG